MNPAYEKLLKCYQSFQEKIDFKPEIAIVLGSGLGAFGDQIQVEQTLSYHELEGFPVSTVKGHKGQFLFGYIGEVPVVLMQGRVHFYEGYTISDVVLPIRLMKLMGAHTLFLTNASGGINPAFHPGGLMMLTDHVSIFAPNPLIGENIEELGTRFPDMSQVYSLRLRNIIKEEAEKLGISLREGVYVQLTGPAYETPAEIRMYRSWGADAVGMSTACEAMAACHMGMEVCGISCITNMAAGMSSKQLDHKEVQETADRMAGQFKKLLTAVIGRI